MDPDLSGSTTVMLKWKTGLVTQGAHVTVAKRNHEVTRFLDSAFPKFHLVFP